LQEIQKLKKKNSHYVIPKKKKVLGGLPATPWVAGVAARHLTWLTGRTTEVGGFPDGGNTSGVVASPDFGLSNFFFFKDYLIFKINN
jgi:hypothetical protein